MYENRVMEPIKNCFKKGGREIRESNGRSEFDQSTLYVYMKISQ
jgi:hypothetical protein